MPLLHYLVINYIYWANLTLDNSLLTIHHTHFQQHCLKNPFLYSVIVSVVIPIHSLLITEVI